MAAPKPVAPKAPQGVWGKPAKAAAAVKDMTPAEVEQLKQLLITMGVMGAPAQPFAAEAAAAQAIAASAAATAPTPDAALNETEQAFLDEQIEKQSQTLEETADGEAFFDNVADAEDAAIDLGVPGNPPAIALPDTCNLDADFGTPQHGDGGWGSDCDDGWGSE